MKSRCLVLCEKCCRFFDYKVAVINTCQHCGLEVSFDNQIEELIVGFNNLGVVTIGSCQGHRSDCGISARAYPWVAILKSESVFKRAESIISSYNTYVGVNKQNQWKIEMQRTSFDWKRFIVPQKKEITELENTEKIVLLTHFIKGQV